MSAGPVARVLGRPPLGSRTRRALAAIAVLALVLRLVWVAVAARPPEGLHDPLFYDLQAALLADGHGYADPVAWLAEGRIEPTAYYPVGYPAALGALRWVTNGTPLPDDGPETVGFVQALAGVALVLLAFELGRRIAGDATGLASAAVMAVWPNLVFHTAVLLSETLFLVPLVAAVVVVLASSAPSRRRLAVAGGLLGLATLIRPVTLAVPVAIGLAGFLGGDGLKRAGRDAGLLVIGLAAVVVPWTVRNVVVLDAVVPISTNTGDNLCIGHHPGATGAFTLPEACRVGDPSVRGVAAELARDEEGTSRAVEFLFDEPAAEVGLVFWRAWHTVEHDHDGLDAVESYGDDPWITSRARGLLAWAADGFWFVVVGFAAVGAVGLGRGRDRSRMAVLTVGASLLIAPLVFFGDPRFKMPAVPFVALAAAVGLVAAWRGLRSIAPGVSEAHR